MFRVHHLCGAMQINRPGLYSQDEERAGVPEASSEDGQEPDWAPVADADSPAFNKDVGDVAGGRKQPAKKRARGIDAILFVSHSIGFLARFLVQFRLPIIGEDAYKYFGLFNLLLLGGFS